MGQVLHGSARTTQAVRRSIQRRQENLQTLAQRYSIDPKTVAKWRKRITTADALLGPKPASTVLTAEEEAIAVAFDVPIQNSPKSRQCVSFIHFFIFL